MIEKERFQIIRKKKDKFTLRTRLMTLMGLNVLLSLVIAYELHILLGSVIPEIDKIPMIVQLSVFCLILTLLSTLFLSKMFFDPIKHLNNAMQKIADGDFSVRLETRSTSVEIQEMIAGFNMMAKELGSTEILQTDFVSNVSHEIKTPINAIEGYTSLLQGCDNLEPDQQEYVEKILFNTRRLSVLVSNILLLSRIENQSIQPHRQPYSLDEQIRESIVSLETAWSEKEIELDVELENVTYWGNEPVMRHVWNNIIGNAIKFSPAGGEVRIRLREQEDVCVCTVEDQGPGLSPEAQRHLFDKFYQGDTSREQEGNGLGLALVKRILTIDGSTIAAENIPGGGCRFTVTMPIRRQTET